MPEILAPGFSENNSSRSQPDLLPQRDGVTHVIILTGEGEATLDFRDSKLESELELTARNDSQRGDNYPSNATQHSTITSTILQMDISISSLFRPATSRHLTSLTSPSSRTLPYLTLYYIFTWPVYGN